MTAPQPPQSRSARSSPRKKPISEDSLRKRALELQPLPTDSVPTLERLLNRLMEERDNATESGKFKDGIRQLRAIEHVKDALALANKIQYQKEQHEDAERQVAEVESRISRFDDETKQEENALKQSLEESRGRLIADCKSRVDKHEALWTSDLQRRKYNRASPQLRSYRFQVKNMLLSKRYKDAELVLATADALQEKEQEASALQMQIDYEKATKLLNEKIQQEMELFDIVAQQQLNNYRKKKSDERTVFENQMSKVKGRLALTDDMDRLWNLSQKQIFEKSRKSRRSTASIKTSRSVAKEFNNDGPMVLTLPPLSSRRALIQTPRHANFA